MDNLTPVGKKGKVFKPSAEYQEVESEDDSEDFETPKALKLPVPVKGRMFYSDSDSDVVEILENEESSKDESDVQDQQSEIDSDLQILKSVDLVKMHKGLKTQAPGKNKRAFRDKVTSEKQVLITKAEENNALKVC